MSSTFKSSSTVDAQGRSSHDHTDDQRPNSTYLSSSSFEQPHLSPYYSHTVSNNTSPYNIGSTPGDSISDFSNYQPSEFSEIEDPFFGVDFGAGVQRIDSLPAAILGNVAYHSTQLNDHQDVQEQIEPKSATESLTASTYPLSPRHTSIPNTPSPRSEINDLTAKTTLSQYELRTELHNTRSPAFSSLVPTHSATLQLTPDHSGSSHTSAEGFEPSIMARPEHSPHLTIPQWGNEEPQFQPHAFMQPEVQYNSAFNNGITGSQYPTHQEAYHMQASGLQDSEGAGRAGQAPESRTDAEVRNFKQQEEQDQLEVRNLEVQEWRSQAGGSSEDEDLGESYFDSIEAEPVQPMDPKEKHNNIPQVDDAASIRENRLQDGQIYYNLRSVPKPEVDEQVMSRPRHWNDGPSLPMMTVTIQQPATSNDAMQKWNKNADTISITSRAATWGTQRRRASEPSLLDYDAVEDGSFLRKLSIKSREGDRRQPSLFDQGLDRIASIVRKRSDAKLKRARSSQNMPQDFQTVPHPRNNSQGSLAPPPSTSSYGRRPTPNINTAIGAMTGSIGAVGNPHARNGSISGAPTSPTHMNFAKSARSVINRVRSRSELTSHDKLAQSGLVGLWKGQGGPPVANLAASPPLETEVRATQHIQKPKPQAQPEMQDQEDDEDEDDELGDDGDMKVEQGPESEPIIANYEGFKAHVRRLNPDMDSRYNWLVSRIAHQQEIRYKNLLDLRVKHSQATMKGSCGAARHCVALGGRATLLDAKGNPRDAEHVTSGLHLQTDFSDDSNPGEGALTDETFPPGVPMPPTRNLPAEFECHLCFKAKQFQKPSDWTKHVHEDVQPFTCTYDKCKEPKSFKRKADWVRHENERHRHLEWWICQVEDCSHPCYRKDNFLQHLVREHKLPEPKQKTKAAIKKARGTEPAWIMLEQCHHETQNRPQDEPCKFCGKSFNTWKKLTVHLAKHMEHISLPILRLVDMRNVDANTIISPVEQILTPVTPISRAKMESASPFNIDSISPHVTMAQQFSSGFNQPTFYTAPGPPRGYAMQPPVPQEINYDQNSMYQNAYGVHPMEQPRGFIPMGQTGLDNMNQGRQFGSMDSGFTQTKVEQSPQFGSMDPAFSHTMPEQNYNLQQTSGFAMPQTFASAPPVASGYQTSNMLVISQADCDFNPIAVNGGQGFQQVPISRTHGSASSYGHPPQNPANYYGQQS
ncbi:hypothetical protein D0Z07_2505 [Hyphodiscus hymeniophilus]|uniref:C2H2-type domain-containing protein n=1 Tax=Hyphodiscus hymeniophilus TaxID=353542 RepID=A0A9P6VMW0_9HELO|nr:hypothetical protein D0Z07_2505 [Hyphodiscus hymeniophilus]